MLGSSLPTYRPTRNMITELLTIHASNDPVCPVTTVTPAASPGTRDVPLIVTLLPGAAAEGPISVTWPGSLKTH